MINVLHLCRNAVVLTEGSSFLWSFGSATKSFSIHTCFGSAGDVIADHPCFSQTSMYLLRCRSSQPSQLRAERGCIGYYIFAPQNQQTKRESSKAPITAVRHGLLVLGPAYPMITARPCGASAATAGPFAPADMMLQCNPTLTADEHALL